MRIHVVSLNRDDHVPSMKALAGGADLVWCVPDSQEIAYEKAGAEEILVGPRGQFEKMNAVLDLHPDEWVVFSDDDCQRIRMLCRDGELRDIDLEEAAHELVRVGRSMNGHYVAASMTSNTRFMSRSVTPWGQSVNWLCAVGPGTVPRFGLHNAGEVRFAAEVCDRYGRIERVNHIMPEYTMADADSLWAAEHAQSKEPIWSDLLRLYPHLFASYDPWGTIKYRRLPGSRRRPIPGD